MAKRKSDAQLADQAAGLSTPKDSKSTLIEDLNALSHDTFQTRFFNNTISTEHKHNDTTWKTQLYFAQELPSELLQRCFQLIETTSRHDYEPSSFGWHPQRKKREMKEPEMRYLLLNEVAPEPQFSGFASFMFTHDSSPSVPVLYIYEIHLTESVRGKGLGGFLMRLIESIAREAGVEKVMLTCFLSNANALAFYRKWGFEVDVCSPGDRRTRKKVVKADYVIMSKDLGAVGEDGRVRGAVQEVMQNLQEGGISLVNANITGSGKRMKNAGLDPCISSAVSARSRELWGINPRTLERLPTQSMNVDVSAASALELSENKIKDLEAKLNVADEQDAQCEEAERTRRELDAREEALRAREADLEKREKDYRARDIELCERKLEIAKREVRVVRAIRNLKERERHVEAKEFALDLAGEDFWDSQDEEEEEEEEEGEEEEEEEGREEEEEEEEEEEQQEHSHSPPPPPRFPDLMEFVEQIKMAFPVADHPYVMWRLKDILGWEDTSISRRELDVLFRGKPWLTRHWDEMVERNLREGAGC